MTEIVLSVVGGATGASAIGSSHIAHGKPNQDAVAWEQHRLWTYIAVADGHGSAPHYRSDRGSRMAVDTLMALFREVTQDGALREPSALMRNVPNLARSLVTNWREKVEADVVTDPIPEPPGFGRHTVYGSTCLGGAIGPGLVLVMQIGDGDLFAGTASGDMVHLFEADDTVGEQTYSLCLPDAIERVKIALFTAPNQLCAPDFVFASTDGFAKSFESEAAALEVVRNYRSAVRERGLRRVTSGMREWLTKCSQMGSGDDTSVAIFTTEVGSIETAIATPTEKAPLTTLSSAGNVAISHAADRMRLTGPAAMACALLCGVIGGLFAGLWGVPFIDKMISGTSPVMAPATPSLPTPQRPDSPAPSK